MTTPQNLVQELMTYRSAQTQSLLPATNDFLRALVDPSVNNDDVPKVLSERAAQSVAILSAPKWFSFGKIYCENGNCRIVPPRNWPLDEAYDVRIFNKQAELRWYRPQGQNAGISVWLSETELNSNGLVPQRTPCVCTLSQTYLIWGRGLPGDGLPDGGWSWLAEHRIERIAVPIPAPTHDDQVQLCAIEYLAQDKHGNVGVVNERLCQLQRYRG